MRSKQAKRLKGIAFRNSTGNPTRYVQDPKTGTIYCTGFRRIYRDLKKIFKLKGKI